MTAGGPLAGKVVLVTRPRDQSEVLVRELDRRGATAIVAPTIEVAPVRSAELNKALRGLASGAFAWITLTSRTTVDILASQLEPGEVRARVAAVGEGTAAAFRRWTGREPDLVPRTFTTAALAHAFPRGRGRVLCPRADIASSSFEEALAAKGWTPLRVDAYRTRMPEWLPIGAREPLTRGTVDAITFTSASSVQGFANAASEVRGDPKIVCIGPVTAREARAHGLEVAAVAEPHTMEGLMAALERAFGGA
jgi:uroporphyrinogen-III synthase